MSKKISIDTIGHPSIYDPQVRTLLIEFEIPDSLSDENPSGMIILIPGYGGNIFSNVYKKMRQVFADNYNLITIQCNYFGSEFMQTEIVKESPTYFNEMGPIQAMDNLIAIKCVKDYCDENGIKYDANTVIAYGHSHGAYLAHMMNVLMPDILSCIIDNSGWVFPNYIDSPRYQCKRLNNGELKIEREYNYIISKIIMDREIYNLETMYSYMDVNHTKIIAFQGVDDLLVSLDKKANFLSEIQNSSLEIIGNRRVDDCIFMKTNHGLGADFLKMFEYVRERYNFKSKRPVLNFINRKFETKNVSYQIDNSDRIPILYCNPKYDYPFDKLLEYT